MSGPDGQGGIPSPLMLSLSKHAARPLKKEPLPHVAEGVSFQRACLSRAKSGYQPSLVVSPSSLFSEEGATIVAMVKSRSEIAGFTPAGRVTALMWIESPTS